MPSRFALKYIGEDGKEHSCFVVHRSSIGTLERTIAFLIEKYAGAFPVWLAPVQVVVLPIGEAHHNFAKKVFEELKNKKIRTEIDLSNESLGKKIRNQKNQKIPYLVVIGDEEVKNNTLTIESRDEGKLENFTAEKLAEKIKEASPV